MKDLKHELEENWGCRPAGCRSSITEIETLRGKSGFPQAIETQYLNPP